MGFALAAAAAGVVVPGVEWVVVVVVPAVVLLVPRVEMCLSEPLPLTLFPIGSGGGSVTTRDLRGVDVTWGGEVACVGVETIGLVAG